MSVDCSIDVMIYQGATQIATASNKYRTLYCEEFPVDRHGIF